ncbi:MAG: non-oxidative hydroxyarylic acid decarboxylases subunit D [Gammaproteobacteria bacterium]|nr:non-oxidative hydroxyarylic acid decarboxylases subunit D [Gammaproteobacteria bacterium]
MNCPRCKSAQEHLRTEYQGREGGELVWTVFYCRRCSFTWRDSEPTETIDYEQRETWFRADPDHPEKYEHNIPPAKAMNSNS